MSPINRCQLNTQNFNIPFVAWNISVKTADRFDHQYTPEEFLHQIDANMFYIIRDVLLYIQWHRRKMTYLERSLSGIDLNCFFENS